jgi:hypothetical protein
MAVYGSEMLAELREIYYTSLETCEKLNASLNKIENILHQQDDLDLFFKSLGNEILCRMDNFRVLALIEEKFPNPFIDVFNRLYDLKIFSHDGYHNKYCPDLDDCGPYHLMGP